MIDVSISLESFARGLSDAEAEVRSWLYYRRRGTPEREEAETNLVIAPVFGEVPTVG